MSGLEAAGGLRERRTPAVSTSPRSSMPGHPSLVPRRATALCRLIRAHSSENALTHTNNNLRAQAGLRQDERGG